uniref:Uncharacterized protein n=1 Tax=Anopheles merus TaxID=30066 RepID=A0A182VGK8_ANOME
MAPLSCECSLHTRLLATSSLSSLIFSTLRISVHSFWLSLTRVVACVSISWHAVSSVDFSPSPCSARYPPYLGCVQPRLVVRFRCVDRVADLFRDRLYLFRTFPQQLAELVFRFLAGSDLAKAQDVPLIPLKPNASTGQQPTECEKD